MRHSPNRRLFVPRPEGLAPDFTESSGTPGQDPSVTGRWEREEAGAVRASMRDSGRLPARASRLLQRAGWSAVALATVVGTGAAAREIASADVQPLHVACRRAVADGHHRLAMRFCRGDADRWKAPAGRPSPTGQHRTHQFLRFRLP